jgi:hypothetical protein
MVPHRRWHVTERQESSDEQPIGWGDDPDPDSYSRTHDEDRDLERLLDDRPPHHDRD